MTLKAIRHWIRCAGLWGMTRIFNQTVPTVLMYHSISCQNDEFFTITPDLFRRQIGYLLQAGHRFVTMDDVAAYYKEGAVLPKNAVCLTFDDGYHDNLTEVLPILEEFGIPAVIYFAAGFVKQRITDKGLPVCTKDQLQFLADHPLITIGAHTDNHPRLSRLSAGEAWNEISNGKALLEEWIGKPVVHFAYPKGDYSIQTIELVKKAGFSTAVTVVPKFVGADRDVFQIGRVPVDQGMPDWLFQNCCREGMTVYSTWRERLFQ